MTPAPSIPRPNHSRASSLERIPTYAPAAASAIDRTVPEPVAAEVLEEQTYFETNIEPSYLPEVRAKLRKFIRFHTERPDPRRIVLVTSGGTTVPLENNTVRFIDNFSAGTRGATSAEEFVDNGYAVVFLHRQFSLLPYSRHYSHTTNCFLDFLAVDSSSGQVVIDSAYQQEMKVVYQQYRKAMDENLILFVPFTTVNQYLFTLKLVSHELEVGAGALALFYLAAAVSDFFVPRSKISEHKIQSGSGGNSLVLDLDPVPKFLKRLVENWAPRAMIVSFKLETDETLLVGKARGALERYSHQLVIGNLLQTRKHTVLFVTKNDAKEYSITEQQEKEGVVIESVIVPKVIDAHSEWITGIQQHQQQ
ncbi:hypothetical protein D0Z00_004235 [Geotrichum galactomycetum]|uniref:Uncharacterized protein n=1 Tax=Geotrichum galactomycetum TaxID=27317 RepID=A0ACB6UZ09_9ASCO|nr:hypothetical protein D0Z00_004235 [Geotrichum candidum]